MREKKERKCRIRDFYRKRAKKRGRGEEMKEKKYREG